jgi:hypothetical protein
MNYRRITGLFGSAAAGALAAGAGIAQAQQNSGSNVDLGGSIAGTVNNAVSGASPSGNSGGSITTGGQSGDTISGGGSSGGTITGATQVQHNDVSLGDQEGVAISDASGGNSNVSFVS